MVATLIDVLIEQNIAATLWLKLPRGHAWQSEIDRLKTASVQTVYVLGNQTSQAAALRKSEAATDWEQEQTPATEPCLVLPLSIETRLRREYFLLVQSPQFTALVLAQRPRSARPKEADFSEPLGEDDLERKHPLMALATCDCMVIDRVVAGIDQVIAAIEPAHDRQTAQAALQAGKFGLSEPLLMSNWLTKQIQQQEEIWHNSAISRRQAEAARQLHQNNQMLLSSLRLKDEFLKTLGQELRTPLTSMKTALSLLNSPTLKPSQRQRYMDMLTQECDRQSSLITSVLDLVQIEDATEQPQLQPLRLADVVPGVVSTYQPLAQEKGVMLAYTIPEGLPPIACINLWLKQIVINLLHNGIKFTPSGGKVWVKARQQDKFVELEVRDTGVGIAAHDLPKIFDRFYRARQNGEDSGAGLGLSIVQQLLIRCGGSISVRSRPAEGSAFSVLLPIYRL